MSHWALAVLELEARNNGQQGKLPSSRGDTYGQLTRSHRDQVLAPSSLLGIVKAREHSHLNVRQGSSFPWEAELGRGP